MKRTTTPFLWLFIAAAIPFLVSCAGGGAGRPLPNTAFSKRGAQDGFRTANGVRAKLRGGSSQGRCFISITKAARIFHGNGIRRQQAR